VKWEELPWEHWLELRRLWHCQCLKEETDEAKQRELKRRRVGVPADGDEWLAWDAALEGQLEELRIQRQSVWDKEAEGEDDRRRLLLAAADG
jgi:hypothetical protein